MIKICSDPEQLARTAAALFADSAQEAVERRGRFSAALSGGGTPLRTYEILAGPPYRDDLPWDRTHIFWGDERCVDPDSPLSNERLARRALLNQVPIPDRQVHPLRCAASPTEAAQRYEALLLAYFQDEPPRLDLVLLGLGEDGHTASLFPHTAVLQETRRHVADLYLPERDQLRVTLTAPLINQAQRVIFLVSGHQKARILREVLEGPRDPQRLPAQLIHPAGELIWLADREAASLLQKSANNILAAK